MIRQLWDVKILLSLQYLLVEHLTIQYSFHLFFWILSRVKHIIVIESAVVLFNFNFARVYRNYFFIMGRQ